MNRKYKDSGIEWIGKIPYNWIYGGLTKFVSSIIDYRGKTPEKVESGVFLVTAKNIKNGEIDYSISKEYVKKEDYKEIMRRGLPVIGDVLFTTEAPLGQVANVDDANIALAQRIIKFRGEKNVLNNYYLKYWISSSGFQYYLQTFATGSTAMGIKASKLSKLIVLLPPFNDQKEIVDFLNEKTFEIDSLIAAKKKLIALLEEQRQAIITEAVTKGLDPNVKMKESDVEWIGEIPESWHVSRLKNSIKSIKNGIWGEEPKNDTNDIGCVRVVDFDRIAAEVNDSEFTIRNIPMENHGSYMLEDGDLLIEKSGGGEKQPVGFVVKYSLRKSAVYANFMARIRVNDKLMSSNFFKFVSYTLYKNRITTRSIKQTTGIQNLDMDLFKQELIPYPSLGEQIEICKYLDEKTAQLISIMKQIKLEIEKLKEYRQSLIYETVTGKIDVRDYKKEEALT